MLTDYYVHCPHEGCTWKGCVFPEGKRDARSPLSPTQRHVVFLCPKCKQEWHARIQGDDAVPLPLQEPATAVV